MNKYNYKMDQSQMQSQMNSLSDSQIQALKKMEKNKFKITDSELNEMLKQGVPPPAKLERIVVPGSWSEIYRAIRENIPYVEPPPIKATPTMTLCDKYPILDESWFKTDPETFAIVKEQWAKDQFSRLDICVCGECKHCLPLESCTTNGCIPYIKLYGMDAYLIHLYGNNKLKTIMMEDDSMYEAQHIFTQREYFSG